jgi:cell division protein FtsA
MQQEINVNNLTVVMDLGTSKIRGMVGRKDVAGQLEIIAVEEIKSMGIKRGMITNLEDAAFCIKRILSLLTNKINNYLNDNKVDGEKKAYEITDVYVGLNGQSLKTIDSSVRRNLGEVEVTQEIIQTLYEENRNVKIENGEILDIVTQEYLVDDSDEVNPVGCICTRIEGRYKIVAGKNSLKNNLTMCFQKAGYNIAGYYLSPVVSASSVVSKEEKELGCAVVDFGAGTTSLTIYYRNILRHISVIPFGSEVITRDIMDLKVVEEVAEKLKVKFGSAMEELVEDYNISTPARAGKEGKVISNRFLSAIIEARAEEIFECVIQQIKESGMAGVIDELVITGGASLLSNLVEKLKLQTGWDVRIGKPEEQRYYLFDEKYLQPEYSQLIGLLAYAGTGSVKEKWMVEKTDESDDVKAKQPKKKKNAKLLWGTLFDRIDEMFSEDSKI